MIKQSSVDMWIFVDEGEEEYLDGIVSQYTVTAKSGGNVCYGFDEARMKLIAAAPDLLEAAKNVMLMGSMEDSMNAYSALRDAIEKATGEMI